MRIVILINSMGGGGAERVVSTLANHFVSRHGHEVLILTLHSGDAYPVPEGAGPRRLRSGILCVGPGRLLALPIVAAEFALRLRKVRPDVVLSLLVRSNMVNVLSTFFGGRRPLILSERVATDQHYTGRGIEARIMRFLIRILYSRADHIIAISSGVRDSLARLGVPKRIIDVIHNPQPIDEILERASEPSPIPRTPEAFSVVTIGRLEPQKDHRSLLAAIALLRHRRPVHLTILGEGPLEEDLRGYAKELGVSDCVHFGGWVENPFAVIAGADLFVLSSRWEGFANVLVEALACGVPVVSTDCESGPREILGKGDFGLLVAPGDVEGLVDAMDRVATDPELARRLSVGSLARARQFDVDVKGGSYLAILEQAASIAPAAATSPTGH